ncbi:MAG TPA: MGMT family protein [Kribbella sp.]
MRRVRTDLHRRHLKPSHPLLGVVPCHRLIGADGNLTGYAGGLERKRQPLDLESPALVAGRLF